MVLLGLVFVSIVRTSDRARFVVFQISFLVLKMVTLIQLLFLWDDIQLLLYSLVQFLEKTFRVSTLRQDKDDRSTVITLLINLVHIHRDGVHVVATVFTHFVSHIACTTLIKFVLSKYLDQ